MTPSLKAAFSGAGFALVALFAPMADAASRLKDIVDIEGVRENQLVGYGLVVGLNGTGDRLRNSPFTEKSIEGMLERLGVGNLSEDDMKTTNTAAVMVTAMLPPFARRGSTIDVVVSSLGDATSLRGGTLVVTPLTGADGEVYAVPHQWGTSGLMADKSKAPELAGWGDLCDPKYKGKTSMRLKRTILLGMAFDMGEDPFAAYADLDKYQSILDKVADKLISCKDNLKAYWKGGDDLSAMMMSGEIVASETWDSTAYKLYGENQNIVFVPPKTGALAWIDTFALPRKGKADDAAYKWINFVMRPEVAAQITAAAGNFTASKGADEHADATLKAQFQGSFPQADLDNIKWYPTVPPGLETIEGKVLDRVKAASSN